MSSIIVNNRSINSLDATAKLQVTRLSPTNTWNDRKPPSASFDLQTYNQIRKTIETVWTRSWEMSSREVLII